MDSVTLNCYNTQAATYADRYEAADMSALHRLLLRHLPARCRILELGCGSGRDAAFLLAHGYDITATDASPAMLTQAARHHPELTPHLHLLSFPASPASLPKTLNVELSTRNFPPFPAILSVAMVMHLTDDELRECATQLRDLLTADGLLVLQLSIGRGGLSQRRDDAGRLYHERPPEEVQLLFERLGFRLVAREDSPDFMNRDISWYTLVLQRAKGRGE
jgi:SAM-dependent methyltransferase